MTTKKCASCKHEQPIEMFVVPTDKSWKYRICAMCREPESYGEKYCSTCGELKTLTEFYKRKDSPNRIYKARCRICECAYSKNWRENNKDKVRKYQWKNKGMELTVEEFDVMLIEQSGLCDLCADQLSNVHVDHCHETGKIRALLCNSCNGMLGLAKDNVATLLNAIKYLQRHGG